MANRAFHPQAGPVACRTDPAIQTSEPVRTVSVTDWGSTLLSKVPRVQKPWLTESAVPSSGTGLGRKDVHKEVNMKKQILLVSVAMLILSLGATVGARRACAQGPAGAGASTAAAGSSHTPHSYNPIKWIKKDSKNSTDSPGSRSEVEKKLTPKLQAQGLLAASVNATDACAPFTALNDCVAALHASHNLGLDFNCLRADVTGVQTSADLSGCRGPVGNKAQSLTKSIHLLKPDADAKGQAKNAEQQAKDDLKEAGA